MSEKTVASTVMKQIVHGGKGASKGKLEMMKQKSMDTLALEIRKRLAKKIILKSKRTVSPLRLPNLIGKTQNLMKFEQHKLNGS